MSEEEYESPYCEVCGHCGEIGCCGIRNFINEHIEGKTNCKNEGFIINDLINLCDYKDEVFEENKQLKSQLQQKENIIKEVREYIEKNDLYEQDYDYDYEENLVVGPPTDETSRKILLEILDGVDKGE